MLKAEPLTAQQGGLLLVLQVLHKVLLTVRIDYHSLVCKHVVQSGGRIWKLCAVALGDNYRHL